MEVAQLKMLRFSIGVTRMDKIRMMSCQERGNGEGQKGGLWMW